MGGWPLLAASIAGQACGHAAAIRSTIHAGCAVRGGNSVSTRPSRAPRSATNLRSTALARPVGIVPGAHAPPARPLHLEHPESPLTALYEHEIIQYGDDRAWFVSFSLQLLHVRGMT